MIAYFNDVHTQVLLKPPVEPEDYSGKTIIVTVGLGKEASKHLEAHRVILAVRTIENVEAAKAEIEPETNRTGVLEVYELVHSSYASDTAFMARVAELERIDIAVLEAAVATEKFEMFEDNGNGITVDVIKTALLAPF